MSLCRTDSDDVSSNDESVEAAVRSAVTATPVVAAGPAAVGSFTVAGVQAGVAGRGTRRAVRRLFSAHSPNNLGQLCNNRWWALSSLCCYRLPTAMGLNIVSSL